MLTDRKTRILGDMIRTYIRQAHPVGSQAIVAHAQLGLSPATVRNEMLELEEEGYLFQPHTSAGRIPTEKAWRFYLDHFLKERPIGKPEEAELRRVYRAFRHSQHELLKHLAQSLAEFMEQAVFVAFGPHDTYYTGISKLFAQPEFDQIEMIRSISGLVDHLDETMPTLFSRISGDVTVLIGRDNPLSDECGILLASVQPHKRMLGTLGPIRQDYDSHVSLFRFTRNLLTA